MNHQETGNRNEMLRQQHSSMLWVYWSVIILGFWLLMAPLTFDHSIGVVEPAGNRQLWLSTEMRIAAMRWNDIICGFLLVVFGWRALTPDRPVSVWLAATVGAWLNLAPLVFWSPTAIGYLNDTLVGVLVIALTILIPGMPNMMVFMQKGAEVPPGWSFNPSSWPQRAILILLGLAGWLVSRHLAAFQLGYTDQLWEPFFGDGSRRVLTSDMSHSMPISDGGLGAFAYTFEFLMGWMGGVSRWRTMPWMVTFFGILVIPLGLVHIILVASQPVMVGEWCTLCLMAALIMMPMIALSVDEVVAMLQFVVRAGRNGKSFWRTFWLGDTEEENRDERTPELLDLPQRPLPLLKAALWGFSAPWNLVLSAIVGLWLMFAPSIMATARPAASVAHVAGAVAITISVVAMGEAIRAFRLLNVVVGLILLVMPFVATGTTGLGRIAYIAGGAAIITLNLPRGKINDSYGSWNRFII